MSETQIVWRRLSSGLSIVGFGAFVLLSTQGLLHRGFWLDAMAFWPMWLIALGLRLIIDRSKAPWAALVSPLILVGTLSYVAWRGPEPPTRDWKTVEAARSPQVVAWTLEAQVAVADLDLRVEPLAVGRLLEGRVSPAGTASVHVSDRDASSRVSLRSSQWGNSTVSFRLPKRQSWHLDVTDGLPLKLRLEGAFVTGEVDLHALELEHVDLDGAFNDLTLRLGEIGEDTEIRLDGAFNHLELVVPEDTPVRVSTDGIFNLVDGRSKEDGRNAPARRGPSYRLRVDGAFNRIVIRSE